MFAGKVVTNNNIETPLKYRGNKESFTAGGLHACGPGDRLRSYQVPKLQTWERKSGREREIDNFIIKKER